MSHVEENGMLIYLSHPIPKNGFLLQVLISFVFVLLELIPSDHSVQWGKPVQDLRLGRQCQGVEVGLHADEHLQGSGDLSHRCIVKHLRIFLLHSR